MSSTESVSCHIPYNVLIFIFSQQQVVVFFFLPIFHKRSDSRSAGTKGCPVDRLLRFLQLIQLGPLAASSVSAHRAFKCVQLFHSSYTFGTKVETSVEWTFVKAGSLVYSHCTKIYNNSNNNNNINNVLDKNNPA